MKDQRYEAIKLFASMRGTFTIEELCEQLNVSVATIRRDIAHLAKEGLVTKYYGKIVWNKPVNSKESSIANTALAESASDKSKDIELRLAHAAADLVEDNDYIFVESGAFVFPLMAKLINKKNVTAVTSDLQIAMCLLKNESLNVIALGGHVWRGSFLLYGDITEQTLSGMHFNKYFTLPGAITSAGEVMYYDSHTGGMRHLLRRISDQTIVIAAKKRVGRSAFLTIGCLDDCDYIVTDCTKEELPNIPNQDVKVISFSPESIRSGH